MGIRSVRLGSSEVPLSGLAINSVEMSSLLDCNDGDGCSVDSAAGPFGGRYCIHVPVVCDDGNACTLDGCIDGDCVFEDVDCDDGVPCTLDSCDISYGCEHLSAGCDDEDLCTYDECDSDLGGFKRR
uniref:Uncharacterized protein n=1 Tax=Arcella intermedia TaxID=1963864 RepID=A0A6B2LKU6_9EUKA